MKLTQHGATVTGTYNFCTGSVQGTMSGQVLSGTWSQAQPRPCGGGAEPTNGNFSFTMSANGKNFTGFYTWPGNPAQQPWTGKRKS